MTVILEGRKKIGESEIFTYNLLPGKKVISALTARGYGLHESLSELIDNSVDAGATYIEVVISPNYISVKDNGCGMDHKQLASGLGFGYSDKNNNLGEYGVGMKSACLSLGKQFLIVTKPFGIKYKFIADFSQDWIKKEDWGGFDIKKMNGVSSVDQFTNIYITTKRDFTHGALDILKHKINLIYGYLMSSGDLTIKINDKILSRNWEVPNHTILETKEIFTKFGNFKYIISELEKPDVKSSGIWVLRRGRLIWIGNKEWYNHNTYQNKMFILITGDFFPISSDKKTFEIEDVKWLEVEKIMKPIVSKEVTRLNTKQEAIPDSIDEKILSEWTKYAFKSLGRLGKKTTLIAQKGKRGFTYKLTSTQTTTNKDLKDKKKNLKNKIKIGEKYYEFECIPIKDNRDDPIVQIQEAKDKVIIYINQKTDIFSKFKKEEAMLYTRLYFYEGIAKFYCERKNEGHLFQFYRDGILRGDLFIV